MLGEIVLSFLRYPNPTEDVIKPRLSQPHIDLVGLSVNASIPSHLLFREKELNLEAQRPARRKLRPFDVSKCLQLGIKKQLAKLEQFADTATQGYRPTVPAVGFPIGSHYRRAGQEPTARHVVVHERLQQHGNLAPTTKISLYLLSIIILPETLGRY